MKRSISKKAVHAQYKVGKSKIHGVGIFSEHSIKAGTKVAAEAIWLYSEGFRGFNHSCNANLKGDVWNAKFVVTSKNIKAGEELTIPYLYKGLKCKCVDKNDEIFKMAKRFNDPRNDVDWADRKDRGKGLVLRSKKSSRLLASISLECFVKLQEFAKDRCCMERAS